MFESAALGRTCDDKEYAETMQSLRMRLFEAQRQCLARKIPVLVTIAGLSGAGRGAVVNLLSEWMDSKHIHNDAFWMETDEERLRPPLWRYWRKLPAAGEIGVFLGGWYGPAVRLHCCGELTDSDFLSRLHRVRGLEASLADSGMAIVKLWLHLDKATYDLRHQHRLAHKEDYHFTPYDKKTAGNYDGLVASITTAITQTDRPQAPWTIVDAADANYRNLSVAQAIIAGMERAMAAQDAKAARVKQEKDGAASTVQEGLISTLDAIDLGISQEPQHYRKTLAALQEELYGLTYHAYQKGISSTLIFEGWDAAGKGGVIRRLTAGVDARITRVIPISAPSDEELAHHYLWRFWRHIPRAGFLTIYDRSWYGRVLVERVEELTPREDWSRAYAEINHFEEQLTENGNILLKFWLHISPEEQLRRFREREETPWKQYKITSEDWRNREKRDAYVPAADEMFLRTSTSYAPWHVIAAENKKYARLAVLRCYRDALRAALDRSAEKRPAGSKKKQRKGK